MSLTILRLKKTVAANYKKICCKLDKLFTSTAIGNEISFRSTSVYNTFDNPATGDITEDLTGARIGLVQKIYHQDGSAPSFPAGWVLVGGGTYSTVSLNIISAEWVSGTRVEYSIIQ